MTKRLVQGCFHHIEMTKGITMYSSAAKFDLFALDNWSKAIDDLELLD
jgi:hypothetical protein